jgi:hypothetical protein
VQAGDAVRVLDRLAHGVTVAGLMAALTGARDEIPAVVAAREHLGARGRDWLDRALGAMRN